jgi:hypothetical protein
MYDADHWWEYLIGLVAILAISGITAYLAWVP